MTLKQRADLSSDDKFMKRMLMQQKWMVCSIYLGRAYYEYFVNSILCKMCINNRSNEYNYTGICRVCIKIMCTTYKRLPRPHNDTVGGINVTEEREKNLHTNMH